MDNVVQSIQSASLAELMSMWRGREGEEWSRSPEIYRALGERILAQGEPLLAYDVIREGLGIWPADIRFRQLQGLGLARSGATERANAILEKLRSEGQTDEETLGMLGRTFKDLASSAATQSEREKFLKRAAEAYAEAYRTTGGYWSGINAATMTFLIGENERACELARKVREQCLKEIVNRGGDLYWELAALGEAALICRDFAGAQGWYARAAESAKNRYGDLQSSRRNARLILKYWNEDVNWIDNFLRVPSVIVFAGHMIDQPGRATPRFPAKLENAVSEEIRGKIDKVKPGFGFSSAACGSDILFLEAMLERGAEVSIVLPYNEQEFVRDSVDFVPNSDWRARFDRVVARAARVITASNQRLEIGGVSYEFCNDLILGLATIRAHQLDTELVPVAVWNGMTGDGPGGAASVVQNWRDLGYKSEIIDLSKIGGATLQVANLNPQVANLRHNLGGQEFRSRIVAILFADAVGFSKLTEPEVARFVQHFLGAIAGITEKFASGIIAKNTWGDGLYFVFPDVDLAGKFALELADLVSTTRWEEKGLRAGLNLRIALHAGPVYEFDDPITGSRGYSGTHVSRAARIEPVTPPGQVYASEAFAALAAAQRANDFTCDYVGQTPMAKGYGTLPMYHVRPRSPALRL
jgi:class 3 adenylate cyclase/tetratricopeptide (TPR) repeat protein